MGRFSRSAIVLSLCLFATGCFRVGVLPYAADSSINPEDKANAVLIPRSAEILSVNGQSVGLDFTDRLANLFLSVGLMYLEPQLAIKPGVNKVGIRVSTSNSFSAGRTTYTTTYWRDYTVQFNAKAGRQYAVEGNYYGGVWIEDKETKERVVG